MIRITDSISIDERDIEERFVRASGPGGQNVNKVATAVELRFDIEASALPFEVKTRLRTLNANRLTAEGLLLIDSREHRTQVQNREAARERLVGIIVQATKRPKRRTPTRPGKAAKQKRLDTKKKRSDIKAARGRRGGDD